MVQEKITVDYLKEYDKRSRFISLTNDSLFKSIMQKNGDILEMFLVDLMNLDISDSDSIVFLDKELIKGNIKEKGKVVDIKVRFGNEYLIQIEVNKSSYEDVKDRNDLYLEKIDTLRIETNNKYHKDFDAKYLYQLNLNAAEPSENNIGLKKMIEYDIINNIVTSERLVKYAVNLEYYYDLYYNNVEEMSFSEIFMAGLMSKNFTELYRIFSNILSEGRLKDFIKDVIEMTDEDLLYNIHYWQKEKMDEMVERNKEARLKREGEKKGIESSKIEMVQNMLKKNTDYEYISEISGKTTDEIKEIEENMKEKGL